MATAEVMQQIVLDELDESILSTVSAAGVSLQELAHRLPKYSYRRVYYRIRSLEKWHLIRTGMKRGEVICFSIGS